MVNIEFVKYDGKYPKLCQGALYVKINGKLISFNAWSDSKTIPDYPPFWESGGVVEYDKNGFIKNLGQDFLSVVQNAVLTTALCSTDISIDEISSVITNNAKFWPLSISQVFGTKNGNIMENEQLDYYKNNPLSCRIKYHINTLSPNDWWLRSPYPNNSYNCFCISLSGKQTGYQTGNGSYGVSLACIIG